MNHIRGYQFFPQLFSNPSTPLLFSHLILPAPGAPPLSLVFLSGFRSSVTVSSVSGHYSPLSGEPVFGSADLQLNLQSSLFPSIPFDSTHHHTHTSASYNLMKSSFDRLINNSRRLEHTSSCSRRRFWDSRIYFFIFQLCLFSIPGCL